MLKAHQIESMLADLRSIDAWLRELDIPSTGNHHLTDPARVKVARISGTLLRASLSDVAVEGETTA